MNPEDRLTRGEIETVFTAAIESVGGKVSNVHRSAQQLFLRSILPWDCEVGPGDRVRAGTALRASDKEVWVHPYILRTICVNGAIFVEAIQTRHLAGIDRQPRETVRAALSAAVCACSVHEAFEDAAEKMKSTPLREANQNLRFLTAIAELERLGYGDLLARVRVRFFGDRDTSQFGLVNAVTSVARDTRDPELRWRLEELGGALCTAATMPPSLVGSAAKSLVEL